MCQLRSGKTANIFIWKTVYDNVTIHRNWFISFFFSFTFMWHPSPLPTRAKWLILDIFFIFDRKDPRSWESLRSKRLSQLIPSWQTVFLVFLSNESLPFEIVESPTEFSFWVFQFLFRRLPQKTCFFFFFKYCVQHFQWIRLVFLDFVNDIPTHTEK